jgi:hypothetical protein
MVHLSGSTNNPIANRGCNPLLLPTNRKQQKFHTPALLLLQTMYIKAQFSPPNSEHGSALLYSTPSYPSLILANRNNFFLAYILFLLHALPRACSIVANLLISYMLIKNCMFLNLQSLCITNALKTWTSLCACYYLRIHHSHSQVHMCFTFSFNTYNFEFNGIFNNTLLLLF